MKVTLVNTLDLILDSIYLCTDSKKVMQFITNNNSKCSPYVMYHINEIRSNTSALLWRYIPWNLNPANDATGPVEFKKRYLNCGWFNGLECFK